MAGGHPVSDAWHAYAFEARGIQRFILDGSRLRDVVGASELLEWVSTKLPDRVREAAGLSGEALRFARCAGGAVTVFSQDRGALERFAALWSLAVRQALPGIEIQHGLGSGATEAEAYRAALARGRASRSRQAAPLPQAGPLTARAPRTGMPAVRWHEKDGLLDEATVRKRGFSGGTALARRFDPGSRLSDWPRLLTPEPGTEEGGGRRLSLFPFEGDNRYLGVVHADGNGLGQLVRRISERVAELGKPYRAVLRGFSDRVAAATEAAAREAVRRVLAPHRTGDGRYPACPIVLGGDDLTILVRGDLALDFSRRFVEAFEAHSRNELAALNRERGLGLAELEEGMTACAGVAFVKANHPFHLAHELAEALCGHAKAHARAAGGGDGTPVPSALSFLRLTASFTTGLEGLLEGELTVEAPSEEGCGGAAFRQTMEAYAAGEARPRAGALPRLDDLAELLEVMTLPEMSRGATRTLLGLLGASVADARRRYARWRQLMDELHPQILDRFDRCLEAIAGPCGEDLPFGKPDAARLRRSPLGDVLALMAVGAGLETGETDHGGREAAHA